LATLAGEHRIADPTIGVPHPYTMEFARMWRERGQAELRFWAGIDVERKSDADEWATAIMEGARQSAVRAPAAPSAIRSDR
jgi:hypothetical protein